MLPRTLFLSLSLSGLAFAACSSSPPSGAASGNDAGAIDSGGSSSGSSGGSSCGSALFEAIPALLTVESTAGGPIACDATLTVVDPDPEAGAGLTFTACTTSGADGCPTLAVDGGGACVYALSIGASGTVGTYTVEIAQAGFASQVVPGVTIGFATCVGIEQASTTTVLLVPASVDASVDAPADATGEDAHADGS